MSRYYRVSGETKKKLIAIHKRAHEISIEAGKLLTRHGAKSGYGDSQGRIFAFSFPDENPRAGLRKRKDGRWVPDSTKAGRAIRAELEAVVPIGFMDIQSACGVALMADDGQWHRPGLAVKDGRCHIKCHESQTPNKDCKRISDIQGEAAFAAE